MSNLPVDRDSNYMREMWGTTHLITDYYNEKENKQRLIQEIMHDPAPKHNFKKQEELFNVKEKERLKRNFLI